MIRKTAVFLTAVLLPAFVAAAPAAPPAPIRKLADAVIHAANADDAAALRGLYADDAVVVDENPPFAWHGAGAGAAWWHVVESVVKNIHLTHLNATAVRIAEFHQTATDAYLIESMTIGGVVGGKPFSEPGTMTYTFHDTAGTWLISSQVWTTKP